MENEQEQEIVLENDEEIVEEETTPTQVEEPRGETTDWKAEALKYQAIANRLKKKTLPTKEIDSDLSKRLTNLEIVEKKRQFGYEYGLSPEETDALFRINPNPTKDDLENPFIKGGIDALRAKRRVAEATPSSSSRGVMVNGKSADDIIKDDSASKDEKQKAWEAKVKRN